MFDRFDICEAWYLYLSTHHYGMADKRYKRLSKLLQWFRERDDLRGPDDLSENGRDIYDALVAKYETGAQ